MAYDIFLTMVQCLSWLNSKDSSDNTFFVKNHSGYFEPALFVRLVSVRGASKASEEGGMGRSRENGETGNLVVLQQLQIPL